MGCSKWLCQWANAIHRLSIKRRGVDELAKNARRRSRVFCSKIDNVSVGRRGLCGTRFVPVTCSRRERVNGWRQPRTPRPCKAHSPYRGCVIGIMRYAALKQKGLDGWDGIGQNISALTDKADSKSKFVEIPIRITQVGLQMSSVCGTWRE